MGKYVFYKQADRKDCAPTCLKMIASHYGRNVSLEYLRLNSYRNKKGTTLTGLSHAAELIGFKSFASKIDFDTLKNKVPLPCIISWNRIHLVVVYKVTKKHFVIADPEVGVRKVSYEEVLNRWSQGNNEEGVVLLLEPTPQFYNTDEASTAPTSFAFFLRYFYPHKNLFLQIIAAVIFSGLINLIVPFITQSVVDIGILGKNMGFIYLVLIAQLMFVFGNTVVSFIQSWISLHLSIRVSLSFVIGYISRLMAMPFPFFEIKTVGDITKRIADNSRIESFLKNTMFTLVVSVFNVIIFSSILGYYNLRLLLIFLLGNGLYIGWILVFLKKRRQFDFERFKISAESENKLLQLYYGAREIILNNIQNEKRWEWERVQARSYKLSKKILVWEQFQASGATIINSIIGAVISLIVASSVINGEMTLGMMMSVQFIMGQIQGPLKSFLNLTHSYQDAKISLERLSEVMDHKIHGKKVDSAPIPKDNTIKFEDVTFQYDGPTSTPVLKDVSLEIPKGKTFAIVGKSGSGKTTMLKLLLKLYEPTDGNIEIGNLNLNYVDDFAWREKCGVVMQDNYIFSDTIANNIVLKTYETKDLERLFYSAKIANIDKWIESLPNQYDTKIGKDGVGMSQGQTQRVLIARAIYKNPDFVFLDEATNALDSENEDVVMRNIIQSMKNKTIIIIAHRLSTIRSVDKIIVMAEGKIIEEGTHAELLNSKGHYHELISKQIL